MNLIKENFKDTALRIYELDNDDRKSLLAEYREWIMNDLDWEELVGINCCQKTWDDGPFGREKEFYGYDNKNSCLLYTSDAADD